MADETTITLRRSMKERLESIKGEKDWNTFLEELYLQKRRSKGRNSLTKLRELLDDREIDRITESSKRFRKEFKIH